MLHALPPDIIMSLSDQPRIISDLVHEDTSCMAIILDIGPNC